MPVTWNSLVVIVCPVICPRDSRPEKRWIPHGGTISNLPGSRGIPIRAQNDGCRGIPRFITIRLCYTSLTKGNTEVTRRRLGLVQLGTAPAPCPRSSTARSNMSVFTRSRAARILGGIAPSASAPSSSPVHQRRRKQPIGVRRGVRIPDRLQRRRACVVHPGVRLDLHRPRHGPDVQDRHGTARHGQPGLPRPARDLGHRVRGVGRQRRGARASPSTWSRATRATPTTRPTRPRSRVCSVKARRPSSAPRPRARRCSSSTRSSRPTRSSSRRPTRRPTSRATRTTGCTGAPLPRTCSRARCSAT